MSKNNSQDLVEQARKEALKPDGDLNLAQNLLLKARAKGNSEASYALATWYIFGENVEIDLTKAVTYLKEAAKQNYPSALYDLAICYEKGEGIEKNLVAAFEHYVRAALWGDHNSFKEVGRCYYYGIGVGVNKNLADIWLERAEEKKH